MTQPAVSTPQKFGSERLALESSEAVSSAGSLCSSQTTPGDNGLKAAVLTPLETLAQSIAGIAPSATPGMLIPIVFGFAGNGTWLSYLLATVGVLFTAQCINVFASRSACPGSLYTFVTQGFGTRGGMLAGWALLFAYVFCGSACVTEFAVYGISLARELFGLQLSGQAMMLLSAGLIAYIAYKNIKLSATLMLWLEFLSVGLISAMVAMTLCKGGLQIDNSQLGLAGVKLESIRMGLVMAIFGFVAFESAASLGSEAREPLKSVPRAIIRSVIFSGVFFVLSSYAMVMSFHKAGVSLDKCPTPLLVMAQQLQMPALGHFVDAGIMVSFFAAGLANLNGAARIVYKMGQDRLFHQLLAATHKQNQTPHIAVLAATSVSLAIALYLASYNVPLVDIVGWLGTLATFGFIYAYAATSLAAAKYLKRLRELTFGKAFTVIVSILVLALSVYGSLIPAPPHPYNLLPFVFAAYMSAGFVYLKIVRFGSTREDLQ